MPERPWGPSDASSSISSVESRNGVKPAAIRSASMTLKGLGVRFSGVLMGGHSAQPSHFRKGQTLGFNNTQVGAAPRAALALTRSPIPRIAASARVSCRRENHPRHRLTSLCFWPQTTPGLPEGGGARSRRPERRRRGKTRRSDSPLAQPRSSRRTGR